MYIQQIYIVIDIYLSTYTILLPSSDQTSLGQINSCSMNPPKTWKLRVLTWPQGVWCSPSWINVFKTCCSRHALRCRNYHVLGLDRFLGSKFWPGGFCGVLWEPDGFRRIVLKKDKDLRWKMMQSLEGVFFFLFFSSENRWRNFLQGPGIQPRTVSHGLFYQAHYQRALQRCEDGVLGRLGLRMPSKSQAQSLGSEEAFMRDVLKRRRTDHWLVNRDPGSLCHVFFYNPYIIG